MRNNKTEVDIGINKRLKLTHRETESAQKHRTTNILADKQTNRQIDKLTVAYNNKKKKRRERRRTILTDKQIV